MSMHADGLTPQALRTSPRSWWDDSFTRRLLDFIPLDTTRLVELDCGLAAAAHVLLPSLPNATYLGLDPNPDRLAEAQREIVGTRLKGRVELRQMEHGPLPLEDGACDQVLSIMSLQHQHDVPGLMGEVLRVLSSGGRLLAVEPDNLGQRFYFDGVLEEISTVFHALSMKVRVSRQPADICLGPRLAQLMRDAGFTRIRVAVHMVQSVRQEPAASFCGRLKRIARSIATEAGLAPGHALVKACDEAIKRCQFAGLPKRVGYSCHLVPVFLCTGRK
jgi:ubiquinone/menaquinone biosynthesis C-methylase UbiE